MNNENTPAAKGLAYNNATADARLAGEESNGMYIFNRFLFHRHLSGLCQMSDLGEIEELMTNKKFVKLLNDLNKEAKKILEEKK